MICAIDKQTRAEEEPTAQAEIVFTLDLAGNFKFVNAAGECLSGYSCEEARRLNVADIVAPELANYVQQILATIGRRFGGVYEIEIITKIAGGWCRKPARIWLFVTAVPLKFME